MVNKKGTEANQSKSKSNSSMHCITHQALSSPLNHRLSPACTFSRYRLPFETVALMSWWRPPSLPSAAGKGQASYKVRGLPYIGAF